MNKGRDKEYLFYEYIITFFADADLLIQYTLRPESGQRKPLRPAAWFQQLGPGVVRVERTAELEDNKRPDLLATDSQQLLHLLLISVRGLKASDENVRGGWAF